mmetsp:Transcript_99119/g.175656  ORF Transcript_99119/g.175656 Transcript_99119/m.175656 type:complete len:154 (-) Transcript_99119:69-530(-)
MSSQSGDDSQDSLYQQAGITTLMIRNIPCRMTLKAMMDLIDSNGFAGTYDFLHLPGRGTPFSNLGYAFINFFIVEMVDLFIAKFQGIPFSTITGINTEKIIEIRPAHAQGFVDNMAKVRDMMSNRDNLYVIGQGASPVFGGTSPLFGGVHISL